ERRPPLQDQQVGPIALDQPERTPPADRVERRQYAVARDPQHALVGAGIHSGIAGIEPLWILFDIRDQAHIVALAQMLYQQRGVVRDPAAKWICWANHCDLHITWGL